MSSASLRVELPAYSHSFEVQVAPSHTIRDVKHEIAKVCPGSPNPVGQRLIWRGRFLKDEEKVEDVWKSPDDSRVIHLAVHPSAWTSAPPSSTPVSAVQGSTTPQSSAAQLPRAPVGQPVPTPSWPAPSSVHMNHSSVYLAIGYIQHMHNLAMGTLSAGGVAQPSQPSITDLEAWRSAAQDLYRSRSWSWPSIFDGPFPSGSSEQGAVYEAVMFQGLPYLQLKTPNATPTAAQAHALQLLSFTFPILSMANDPMFYAPPNPYPPQSYAAPTDVNQRLHQLGLPALRVANANPNDPNHNPIAAAAGPGAAEIRAIPMRALMVSLMMLAFRTLLILYFFSPSKRPLFGLMMSAWILYEAWNAMRLVLNDGNERGADGAANPAAPNAAGGAEQQGQAAGAPAPNANGLMPNASPGRSGILAILDRLAMLNLSAEDAMLDTDVPAPPPSFGQKVKMVVSLFFMSFYPAAWDRRRIALRRREGRIRTEANAREAAEHERNEGSAQGEAQPRSEEDEARARAREQMIARHERRPVWLREYVHRVQYTEWVDDP